MSSLVSSLPLLAKGFHKKCSGVQAISLPDFSRKLKVHVFIWVFNMRKTNFSVQG